MISNLANNFLNANNFTPQENNLLPRILPLNDMQATFPSPPPQKVPKMFRIKKERFSNSPKKLWTSKFENFGFISPKKIEGDIFFNLRTFQKKYCWDNFFF